MIRPASTGATFHVTERSMPSGETLVLNVSRSAVVSVGAARPTT